MIFPKEITVEDFYETDIRISLKWYRADTSTLLRMAIWAEHLLLRDPVRVRSEGMEPFRHAVIALHSEIDTRLARD